MNNLILSLKFIGDKIDKFVPFVFIISIFVLPKIPWVSKKIDGLSKFLTWVFKNPTTLILDIFKQTFKQILTIILVLLSLYALLYAITKGQVEKIITSFKWIDNFLVHNNLKSSVGVREIINPINLINALIGFGSIWKLFATLFSYLITGNRVLLWPIDFLLISIVSLQFLFIKNVIAPIYWAWLEKEKEKEILKEKQEQKIINEQAKLRMDKLEQNEK